MDAVQETTAASTAALDQGGLVAADVPCRRCSYNLRSLNVNARCPECAAPVGVSVHGPLLRYGDPDWVRNLGRGAGFVFWGILGGILIGVLSAFVTMAFGPYVGQAFVLAGSAVQLYGAWLLTEPDPSRIGEDQYGTARRIIRVCLVVGAGGNVVELFSASAGRTPTIGGTPLQVALAVAAAGAGLIGLVGQFAMLRYLEKLTLRIPDPALSRRARVLLWGYGCSLAAMTLVGGAAALVATFALRTAAPAGPGATSGPAGLGAGMITMIAAAGIFAFAAFVSLVVFGIVYLVLLHRLQQVFAEQARFAEYLWGKGEEDLGFGVRGSGSESSEFGGQSSDVGKG